MADLDTGWLRKQLEEVKQEANSWPSWKRREAAEEKPLNTPAGASLVPQKQNTKKAS
jgi:hypothetical protein